MAYTRKIFCPSCGRKVMTHDGKSEINKTVKCKKCKRLVLFNVSTGEIKHVPFPERKTSSGKRYY